MCNPSKARKQIRNKNPAGQMEHSPRWLAEEIYCRENKAIF